jgi:hypothetical protein
LYLAVVEVAAVVTINLGAVEVFPSVGGCRGVGVIVVVVGYHCCRKSLETPPYLYIFHSICMSK